MQSQLDRFNRHLKKKFDSLNGIQAALAADYARTKSCAKTGKNFGVTGTAIRQWLAYFGIPRGSRGGPNFITGPKVADQINAADQAKLATMTSHEIGRMFGCTGRYVQWLRAQRQINCDYVGARIKRRQ